MEITAYLLAFNEDVPIPTRTITIPDEEINSLIGETVGGWDNEKTLPQIEGELQNGLLERVFYYGQNDFQPQNIRSLSVGDVIKLPDGSLHRVRGIGWEHLSQDTDITALARGWKAALLR